MSQNKKIELAEFNDNKMGEPLKIYSERFAQVDPKLLCARSGIAYNEDTKRFSINVMNRPVVISWPEMQVSYTDDESNAPDNLKILLGRLLLEGKLIPSTGKFVSYAEIPWGDTYYKPFEGRCLKRLAYMFKDAQSFSKACESIGATKSAITGRAAGDASYDLEFVDGVIVRLTIWEADEDFAPNASISFSDNIQMAFTAEDIAYMGDIILNNLKAHRG